VTQVEQVSWERPEMSARIFKVMLVQFEKEYGRARLEGLWATRGLPLSLAYAENLSNFVSLAFVDLLLDALEVEAGDPGFITRAARSFVTPDAMGFPYYLLRSLGTPLLVYKKTVELGSTYNKVGRFEVLSAGTDTITVSYSSSVRETSRRFCELRRINYAIFPNIWGLPDAQVEETACQVHGADACRYVVKWRSPVGNPRAAVLSGLGLLGGLASVLWLEQPGLAIGALGVLGALLGAVLDGRKEASQKDALLREQTAGLSASLAELQKKADELYAANVKLDQRVAERTHELKEALERLQKLDQLKSEFFANVSHELRTPLTLVLAPVEDRLSDNPAGPERELLNGIRRNARRLLRFIDDLLDLSRIDSGQLRLDVVPVDGTALVQQVVGVFSGAAEARGVKVRVEGPLQTMDVWGDPHRLESVLSNLVGNAFKFTPDGGDLRVVLQENHAELRVAVKDSGPGIPRAEWEAIFQRYYQVADGRRRGGVGIGLALAQSLAGLHGGRIEVMSVPGQGATFTLCLPKGRDHFPREVLERRRAQVVMQDGRRLMDGRPEASAALSSTAAVQPVRVDGRRARVLVVEDNAELRALLQELLSPSYDVLVAEDGAPALALVKRERPDLVLSDVMMPGMSGTALCVAIKSDALLRHTPVLLLTARSGADAALEGFAAGADEFVEKPFHPRVLLARVRAQLRLKELGLQVAANARLAVVGTLAAGVGHEVRNPVNAVLNGVRVLRARSGVDEADLQLLDVIVDGAERIERISAALLGHASPGDLGGARPTEVREGLEATLRLLEHRLKDTRVHRALGEGRVVVPAAELNQVFLNLVDNALKSGAKNVWVTVAQEDAVVRVTVEDDGPGVPFEHQARIFDPFFTTRAPGEGTGLGLYLARQSVQRWGGTLQVATREGGGARFTVALPKESR
jgi:signal transduction histidine kinase